MFLRTLNELRVKLAINISSDSLLLIKEGRHTNEKGNKETRIFNEQVIRRGKNPQYYKNADQCFAMAFVFSHTRAGDCYYLPGSSLRGVLRQAAERTIAERRPDLVVDPFARHDERWAGTDRMLIAERDKVKVAESDSSDVTLDSAKIYRESRPIERCFGHTLLRGRWSIEDAWPEEGQTPGVTIRDGVGIDRASGAAREQIKFDFEALSSGTFTTTLTLVNYELWQLGLLAHVLAALDVGEVRLGYGTRRGLGRVRWTVQQLAFRWYPELPEAKEASAEAIELDLPTLAALARATKIAGDYGWHDDRLAATLSLRYEAGLPVGSWVLKPTAGDDYWSKMPWPQLGALLGKGLADENWRALIGIKEAP